MDEEERAHDHPKGFFESLNSKSAYWLGVASALGIVFTIGFFVLLNATLNQGGSSLFKKSTSSGSPTAPSTAVKEPSAPAPLADIQLSPISDNDHVRGARSAKISIVEFSDPECPFCKRFHPTMQQVIKTYGDKVNWVYRHFPLDSLHPKARKEAEATECAAELGGNDAFWKYIDRLFEVTPSNNGLDPAQLPQIAKDVGLNSSKFEDCLKSGRHAQTIQDHQNQAIAASGQGTPYSVIVSGNDKIPVNGAVPFEQLKQMLDSIVK